MEISWNCLPSVVLLELFSYLSHEDRIQASSTCKSWRWALFQNSYWQNIHFKIKTNDEDSVSRTRFLTSCCAKRLRNATLTFNSLDPLCLLEVARILKEICNNMNLQRLKLEPSNCIFQNPDQGDQSLYHLRIQWGDGNIDFFQRCIIKPLQLLVQQCRGMEALCFGSSEDLVSFSKPVLDALQDHQACSLRNLGLATVKNDPDNYELPDLNSTFFQSFQRLQALSIDYDFVSDRFLSAFDSAEVARLIIHVHGIPEGHPGTTNLGWTTFTQRNPRCELRINLIHSVEGAEELQTEILKPAMRLTHLKCFFCGTHVKSAAFHQLSAWYATTLRSIWLIESIEEGIISPFLPDDFENITDPFVMASWLCHNLEEIVILGYEYSATNVLAMARLRGSRLKRLELLGLDIAEVGNNLRGLEKQVGEALGRDWEALTCATLPEGIVNSCDTDRVILSSTQRDFDI